MLIRAKLLTISRRITFVSTIANRGLYLATDLRPDLGRNKWRITLARMRATFARSKSWKGFSGMDSFRWYRIVRTYARMYVRDYATLDCGWIFQGRRGFKSRHCRRRDACASLPSFRQGAWDDGDPGAAVWVQGAARVDASSVEIIA
jgi:hypothetical protein